MSASWLSKMSPKLFPHHHPAADTFNSAVSFNLWNNEQHVLDACRQGKAATHFVPLFAASKTSTKMPDQICHSSPSIQALSALGSVKSTAAKLASWLAGYCGQIDWFTPTQWRHFLWSHFQWHGSDMNIWIIQGKWPWLTHLALKIKFERLYF